MKKYISLLILAAVLSMQSCHREDIDTENMNHVQNRTERQSAKQTLDPANTMRNGADTGYQDTGDDDEPKRDKQHWRISNDSIKKSMVKSTLRLGYGKSNDCPQHRKEMPGKR